MFGSDQIPFKYQTLIEEQIDLFSKGAAVTDVNRIPDSQNIPAYTREGKPHWFRIPDVICIFVDMKGSTVLSAQNREQQMARIYQLFTGTAVRVFDEFESSYIDVRGDGAFALFNKGEHYRAIAAAVTFKTFASEVFVSKVQEVQTSDSEDLRSKVGSHIGIDQRTILVKKVGMRPREGRSDRRNEVWAGRTVNMAAKLASRSEHNEILVSDRFFQHLKSDRVLRSCDCNGERKDLWQQVDVREDNLFDFETAHRLKSNWCVNHGREYCEDILRL